MNSSPKPTLAARIIAQFVSRDLTRRDLALDAFRGLMIMGMILVNHPPPTDAIYAPLVHAAWNGWTLADTIFPGFLFAVGFAVRMSMVDGRGEPLAGTTAIYSKIVRRFAILLLLNFLLINFPYYFGVQLRFSGTLALIAWCYLFTACAHLQMRWVQQLVLVCVVLVLQWMVLALLPIPGAGAGTMTLNINAARYLDTVLFAPLFGPAWIVDGGDVTVLPGLGVPALGALASTLIGLLAAHWMSGPRSLAERLSALFAAGIVLSVLGSVWDLLLPVNKNLWTGSYVLLMAGIALQLFAFGTWLVRQCGLRAWALPLQVAGANALLFYLMAQSIQRLLVYGRVPNGDGSSVRFKQVVYEWMLSLSLSGEFGSLLHATAFLVVCYAVVLFLFRRRIFLKL